MLQKKKEIHTEDTTSHGEKKRKKKKGEKKEEVPSTGIELANVDVIVLWFQPLRHSGMNLGSSLQFFQTKTNQALAGTLH